jgi:LysR family transcriptional regulator, low CO2-responsive transcriptional regulator
MDNRISLRKLEILCLVVELGGVGRAADRLHVSQPVVTAHMRLLQDRLGVELLYRDGQQMKLTEAGKEVYRWAKEVLGRSRELSRAIDEIADGSAGTVVIAASMSVGSYLLPRVLGWFSARRPEANLTLHVCDSEDAQRAAESGECDFAVVTGSSALTGGALRARRIGDHDLVLVAAPGDRIGATVTPEELAQMPFVCSPRRRPRRRMVEDALAEMGIAERRVVLELGHPEALKAVIRMGAGVALLLRAAVEDELQAGTLREISIDGHRPQVPVVLVHRTDKRFTPMQRQLLEALFVALGDAPATERHSRAAIPA